MEETENQEVKSKKQAFIEKMKARMPDLNTEDEDGLYGQIDADYADYAQNAQTHIDSSKRITDLFNSDIRGANLFARWASGEDPMVAFIGMYGDEIIEMLGDPKKSDEFVKANAEYRERILKSTELDNQAGQNLDASVEALDQVVAKLGVDDNIKNSAFELFNKIINDAIVNKVSEDTWKLFIQALMHDSDVIEAEHIGKVGGRNEKIELKKAEKTTALPPQISGKGAVVDAPKKETRGFNLPPQPDIFEGAKRRKLN